MMRGAGQSCSRMSKVASSSRAQLSPKKVVGIVFIALVCDLLAFTMPLPLFPRLINDFVEKEAAQGSPNTTLLSHTLHFVRSIRRTLFSYSSFASPLSEVANARWDLTLLGGLLASLFSLCQFIISPHLGSLSDKYGRRPVLLFSMIGNLVSAFLWLVANSFGVYALSRVVGGLSEGNVQLTIAVISDVTSSAQRSKSLALVGVAFSLAFTLGPSLGAYFAERTIGKGERIMVFGREVLLNGYALPAAVTLGLLVVETAYLAVALPETRWYKEGKEEEKEEKKAGEVDRSLEERKERLKQLQKIHGWFLFFFSGAEFTLTFLTYNLFSYTNAQNGKLLGFIGILSSLLQGGYVRRRSATPNGPQNLARAGIVSCALSLTFLTILPHVGSMGGYSSPAAVLLYSASAGLAFVSATVVTSLTAMASLECSSAKEGEVIDKGRALGLFRSRGQLGRATGPLVLTAIYWVLGPSWAYGFAAVGAGGVAFKISRLGKGAKKAPLSTSAPAAAKFRKARPFGSEDAPRKARGLVKDPSSSAFSSPDSQQRADNSRAFDVRTADSYQLTERVNRLAYLDQLDDATALVKSARAANVVVWNVLIHQTLMRTGSINKAFALWAEMKRRGVEPSLRSFTTFFRGCAKGERAVEPAAMGKVKAVYAQWELYVAKLTARDGKGKTFAVPEDEDDNILIPMNAYLHFLGRTNNVDEMLKVLDSMPSSGPLAPDGYTYSTVLAALYKCLSAKRTAVDVDPTATSSNRERFDAALAIWSRISSDASLIDMRTVSIMMTICRCAERPDDQVIGLHIARDFFGFVIDPAEEASLVKMASTKPPLALDGPALSVVLSLALQLQKNNLVVSLFNQVRDYPERFGRDIISHYQCELALVALGNKKDSEAAEDLIHWMRESSSRVPLALSTWSTAFQACWRAADLNRALRLYSLMTGRAPLAAGVAPSIAESAAAPPSPSPSSSSNDSPSSQKPLDTAKLGTWEPDERIATTLLQTALATRDRGKIYRTIELIETDTSFGPGFYAARRNPPALRTPSPSEHWRFRLAETTERALDKLLDGLAESPLSSERQRELKTWQSEVQTWIERTRGDASVTKGNEESMRSRRESLARRMERDAAREEKEERRGDAMEASYGPDNDDESRGFRRESWEPRYDGRIFERDESGVDRRRSLEGKSDYKREATDTEDLPSTAHVLTLSGLRIESLPAMKKALCQGESKFGTGDEGKGPASATCFFE
ncbi:hypothetical protein MNV49_006192 [Pseudohyphozyma bogoriensis]|nr:hypothetical protein MNV49_006192 [Pseudohyphozyma bogoriensis]